MTLALIVLAVLTVIAIVIAPVAFADRAGRRRTDAADTAAAGQYWDHVQAAVATRPTDYQRTLADGFMEDADAYAARLASLTAASPTVPAQTRKGDL